jgi:hypothetical protein
MTTILVWFLVTTGSTRTIVYSPPMPTLEECQRLMATQPMGWAQSKQCVQLKVVKL